ncbi:CoA-transferase [Bacillota bacterium Lsc_1132]
MENPYGKITTVETIMPFFHDGMALMFGGFRGVSSPPTIIESIVNKGDKNLTLIGNDTGFPEIGIRKLILLEQAAKIIVSHIGL